MMITHNYNYKTLLFAVYQITSAQENRRTAGECRDQEIRLPTYGTTLFKHDRKSLVVMPAHAMFVISLAFSSASTRKFICTKNTHTGAVKSKAFILLNAFSHLSSHTYFLSFLSRSVSGAATD